MALILSRTSGQRTGHLSLCSVLRGVYVSMAYLFLTLRVFTRGGREHKGAWRIPSLVALCLRRRLREWRWAYEYIKAGGASTIRFVPALPAASRSSAGIAQRRQATFISWWRRMRTPMWIIGAGGEISVRRSRGRRFPHLAHR